MEMLPALPEVVMASGRKIFILHPYILCFLYKLMTSLASRATRNITCPLEKARFVYL